MTTPDIPLRMELVYELPGTQEQVWDAIATARGISAWFIPTEIEEHEGGSVVFHVGEDDSPGTVTGWEPPGRLAYVEPDWAALADKAGSSVTPLATEFLVEARSGGTCVVRIVTSAFGTGADWEQEFFDEMEKGWTPYFEHLRLYLTHFPGQTATVLSADADVPGTAVAACKAMCQELGVDESTKTLELRGLAGEVEVLADQQLLVRLTGPLPGYIALYTYDKGDGVVSAQVAGYLFSAGAPAYVEREQPGWKTWLQNLAVSTK
jgi:uncharacterized protein YndB with AHSA1/START domain